MRRKLLPYYDKNTLKPKMIVFHSVAFPAEKAIEVFSENKVSSHYLIAENGELWQLVGERNRAYHAGLSYWQGISNLNSCAIGIELCSPSLGEKKFTKAQKETTKILLKRLIKKYKINPQNIVGHSDIAPSRKTDPGKSFFWKELAKDNLCLWYNLKNAQKVASDNIPELLNIIGYDPTDILASSYAFCRHFLPQKVPSCSNINNLAANNITYDKNLLNDKEFLTTLKAVAYTYLSASKTPCKI